MNLASTISNQTTIYYAENKGIEIAKARGYAYSSPIIKKKSNKASTTKDGVQRASTPPPDFPARTLLLSTQMSTLFHHLNLRIPWQMSPTNRRRRKRTRITNMTPAVYFEESRIHMGAQKFKFCLFGKFPSTKPSLEKIRYRASKEWKLEGNWSITTLDRKHVFVRLENESDMIPVWPRHRWSVGKHLMKVFKWLPTFRSTSSSCSSTTEPSVAAVWISLPQLLVVLFQEDFLYKIASLVGRGFCMDEQTKNMSRPSMARVCVEVDLVKDLPSMDWDGKRRGLLAGGIL